MKWFEPIIAVIAVFFAVLPFIIAIRNHKKGRNSCSCGCSCCSKKDECYKALKGYINSDEFKNDLKSIKDN